MIEKKLSDRFKHAVQGLKEVVQRGGLAQDDTPKKVYRYLPCPYRQDNEDRTRRR